MKQSSKQIFTVCLIKTRSLKNRNTLTLDTNTLLRNTKYFNKQLGMCCTQRWKAKLKDNVLLANLFSGLRMAVTTWLLLLPSLIVKPFGIIKLLDIDSLMIYKTISGEMEDGLNLSTFLNIHVGKKMDKQLKWAMRFYDSSSNRGGEESIHFYLMK